MAVPRRCVPLSTTNIPAQPSLLVRVFEISNGPYHANTFLEWGDIVRIVVHNDLPDNGTSIHWHGVRQLHSNPQDGANGITECPIASGTTKTYEFRATQHGTSW